MFTFTRYIQWPEEANKGDFEILVLGDSPYLSELKTMAEEKKVGTRNIKVTKINSVNEVRRCHILFIPESKSDLLETAIEKTGNNPTLVVTEQPGLAARGSGINFIHKDGKPAIELNNAALSKKKLRASSQLTQMAILI
jgi:hypothetical protein